MQLTNWREAAAFFMARVIAVVALVFITPAVLSPLYAQLYRTGGAILITVATSSVGVVMWLATLVLFLLLRAGLGGVPAMVAGQGPRDAVTTSVGEMVAYLVGVAIVMVMAWAFTFVLVGIYMSLRESGGMIWVVPISLGVSAVFAVVFFLIFVTLRRAMSGVSS